MTIPYRPPDHDHLRRRLTPRAKRILLGSGVIAALAALTFAGYALYVYRAYGDFLASRAHLRDLAFLLDRYTNANADRYPPDLSVFPSEPSVAFVTSRPGFVYLGAGLQRPRVGHRPLIPLTSDDAGDQILVARGPTRLSNGDIFIFVNGAVECIPHADIPAALARSAAARAEWEATTRPAIPHRVIPPNSTSSFPSPDGTTTRASDRSGLR